VQFRPGGRSRRLRLSLWIFLTLKPPTRQWGPCSRPTSLQRGLIGVLANCPCRSSGSFATPPVRTRWARLGRGPRGSKVRTSSATPTTRPSATRAWRRPGRWQRGCQTSWAHCQILLRSTWWSARPTCAASRQRPRCAVGWAPAACASSWTWAWERSTAPRSSATWSPR
ncbi:unnamed protein product, partial [Polarella glacialis]